MYLQIFFLSTNSIMKLITCSPLYGRLLVTIMLFIFITSKIDAQHKDADTLTLTIQEAEKRFIDSNLILLASHYNLDANIALIEQAKLWSNPILVTDQVISAEDKFFPYGKSADGSYSGQYFIQLQQLVTTAGKRGKLINLATTNSKIAELQLQDALRNLRSQLHKDFYILIQQTSANKMYDEEALQLSLLLKGMKAELDAGNIAQKDFLRVQALTISLQQDITDLKKQTEDTEAELRTILQIQNNTFIQPVDNNNISPSDNIDVFAVIDSAKLHNPYYLFQQAQGIYQQQNLVYQKSLRIPDITLGPEFDRNSSFAPNYFGLTISLPLPVFNKNQGNIKAAGFAIQQQEALTQNAATQLSNNIITAYNKRSLMLQQNNAVQKDFYDKYQVMFENMLHSYKQKQIGLLEFLDFFETYKDTQLKLLQQQLNLHLSADELNYQAGIDVIK